MTISLADRIRMRLKELGKSAAGASLEAGLGRSAVQDILAGNSNSPRVTTMIKLAAVLDCSPEYLMGMASENGPTDIKQAKDVPYLLDATEVEEVTELEANVFRRDVKRRDIRPEKLVSFRDRRFINERHREYVTNDNSMAGVGIFEGDYVTAVDPLSEVILKDGLIVVCRHNLGTVEEYSIRQVRIIVGIVHLVTRPSADRQYGDPIKIRTTEENDIPMLENTYWVMDGSTVEIEALVVRVTRVLSFID